MGRNGDSLNYCPHCEHCRSDEQVKRATAKLLSLKSVMLGTPFAYSTLCQAKQDYYRAVGHYPAYAAVGLDTFEYIVSRFQTPAKFQLVLKDGFAAMLQWGGTLIMTDMSVPNWEIRFSESR